MGLWRHPVHQILVLEGYCVGGERFVMLSQLETGQEY